MSKKLSAALLEVTNDDKFWTREVYEFCRRGGKGDSSGKPSKGKNKGGAKGSVKGSWKTPKGKSSTTKGQGKKGSKKGSKNTAWVTAPPASAPSVPAGTGTKQWATVHTDGSQFCKKYHAFNNCPGGCNRCHLCPILLPGGHACGANHRASTHP